MLGRVTMFAIAVAAGSAMAQSAPPPAHHGNGPAEMRTAKYRGTLVDLSCGGAASAEPRTAERAAGECKVSPESKELGMRLNDGRTLRFDMVGTERAREEMRVNKHWSRDVHSGQPIHATVLGAVQGDKLIVSSIR